MSHYSSNNRDRSSRHGGHRGRDSRPSKTYDAVCSNCGNDCQVPFKPTGDRPVYCSDCFEANGGKSSDRRSSDRRSRQSSQSGPSQQSIETLTRKVDQINAKLDDLIAAITSYEEDYDDEEEYDELKIEVEPVVDDTQPETESDETTEEPLTDTDSEEPKTK